MKRRIVLMTISAIVLTIAAFSTSFKKNKHNKGFGEYYWFTCSNLLYIYVDYNLDIVEAIQSGCDGVISCCEKGYTGGQVDFLFFTPPLKIGVVSSESLFYN